MQRSIDGVTRFRHYKGGIYHILHIAKLEINNELCVVYRSEETNQVWVRSHQDFFGKLANGNQRFKMLSE